VSLVVCLEFYLNPERSPLPPHFSHVIDFKRQLSLDGPHSGFSRCRPHHITVFIPLALVFLSILKVLICLDVISWNFLQMGIISEKILGLSKFHDAMISL
jgi:hypothetical protein